MEELPDDALLRVLRFVDVPSLLTCRLVCKRLGDLALHADAWRHREFGNGRVAYVDRYCCMCPVLRLAPCLRLLQDPICVDRPANTCRSAAFAWTSCAVAELRLQVKDDTDAGTAAVAILRQEALGRLRLVDLHFAHAAQLQISDSMANVLLATVASTRGLDTIKLPLITANDASLEIATSLSLGGAMPTPSVKLFECGYLNETFLKFILTAHSATLETVRLNLGVSSMSCTYIAPLLAGLPNLKELSCWNLPGLEAVAACESLRDLTLTLSTVRRHRRGAAAARTAAFLSRAVQLRELTLRYGPINLTASVARARVGVDALRALASTGRSRLETLFLIVIDEEDDPSHATHVQALIEALPSLPALQKLKTYLHVKQENDALLLSITPATAPALLKVQLGLADDLCAHAWFHGDTFKTVMARNPLLHLNLYGRSTYCRKESCPACSRACHYALLRGLGISYVFCHDPDENCPLKHKIEPYYFTRWVHYD